MRNCFTYVSSMRTRRPPCPPLIGEVEAPIVVPVRLAVEKVNALVPKISARMVVYEVEYDARSRNIPGIDVIQHDGNERLHAGHSGGTCRIGPRLFLGVCGA